MTIHIPITDLSPEVKKLYLEKKIISIGIDYHPNNLTGWVDGKEIEVFPFGKVCKMDNRFTGYNLYCNPTEIVIEVVW